MKDTQEKKTMSIEDILLRVCVTINSISILLLAIAIIKMKS